MLIKSAEFVLSSKELSKCPKLNIPEYAFIGRSNVGKSSLINLLVNRKKLAKTSGTPGKTRLINHFIINDEWYLVDLPGIGYAKMPKSERLDWDVMVHNYLSKRQNLLNTFVLIDSRHTLLEHDTELIDWFGKNNLPFTIVFTKTDKLSKLHLSQNIATWKNYLKQYWEELPQMIGSSYETGVGKDEILNFIEETNKLFNKK